MNTRFVERVAIGIAALGLLAPPKMIVAGELPVTATPVAAPSAAAPAATTIADVALGANGTLRGQVVDAAGGAVAGVSITVRQQENIVAQTTSRPSGDFEIAGLPGGVFRITTDQTDGSFRLWATETAPPGAQASVLVVQDSAAVRGQSALGRMFSRPLAIAALVVTAVAVPVVIHQIQIDHKSSS